MEKYYEKYEQRYKAVYAAGADQWGYTPDDTTLNAVLRNWVSAHELQGKTVLELCCGEGGAGVILSKLGCGYHGIDLAPSALETAKRLLSPFPAASVERLDLATETIQGEYDAALDVMGFHMLLADQDRAAYLRNVYQALCPGAPMLFFNEAYSANGYEGTVDSYEQWLVVLGLSLTLAVAMWFAADDVLALTKADNVITVTIQDGDTLEDVAQNLKDHGLVRYKFLFVLYGKFSHAEEKFSAGTFELNQLFDYHALVNGLASSSETRKTVTLTFPEGYSCDQIFSMLADNDVCSLEDLKDTAANYEFDFDFLQSLSYGDSNRLEGYLFPDTYDFYVDDDPVRVINKLLANFDSKFTETMQADIDTLNQSIRVRMETEGSFSEEEIDNAMMDVRKILTVASLIEKEAGSDQERSLISSVIYNRLNTRVHELLQIDATVEYALGEHKTELTANDLAVDNPYNTYKNKGLPPGPIANPGIASIMAAIHPDNTGYYFYALNDTGTHTFFETYMDQQDFLNGITSDSTDDETTDENQTDGETANNDGVADDEEPYYQETVVNEDGEEETVNAQ